ncbi:hypothetical protein DL96DRAFT_1821348 [Flagelloscypha sp. PMI_526]|nr:hypothetical protein DL96DRAFT_1821348 [Flagelloscypha sp. PMI_526]
MNDRREENQEERELPLDDHVLPSQEMPPTGISSEDLSVTAASNEEQALHLWGNQGSRLREATCPEQNASAPPSASTLALHDPPSAPSLEAVRSESASEAASSSAEEVSGQLTSDSRSSPKSNSGCFSSTDSLPQFVTTSAVAVSLHDFNPRHATNSNPPPSSFMSTRSSSAYAYAQDSPRQHHRASLGTKSQRRNGYVDMTGFDSGNGIPPVPSISYDDQRPRTSPTRSSAPVMVADAFQKSPSTRARKKANRHSHSGHLQLAAAAHTSFEPLPPVQNARSYGRQSLDGASSLHSPRQPLYQYIRPNKDSTLNLSPSASPSRPNGFPASGSSSRSTSLDIARSGLPTSHGSPRRPTSSSTTRTSRSVSSPRASIDTARPSLHSGHQSKFLDIPYHEGMSAEDVQLPGPECLTPPGQGIPLRLVDGHTSIGHRTGASVSGQMEQYMSFATANMGNGNMSGGSSGTSNGHNGEFETASGKYKFSVDPSKKSHDKSAKKKKKGGGSWKRLSAGFMSLVGGK